jgi:hypothetical protein
MDQRKLIQYVEDPDMRCRQPSRQRRHVFAVRSRQVPALAQKQEAAERNDVGRQGVRQVARDMVGQQDRRPRVYDRPISNDLIPVLEIELLAGRQEQFEAWKRNLEP